MVSSRSVEGIGTLVRDPAVAVATADFSADGPLSDAESDYIASAVESRRLDFATGRRCAIDALRLLGVDVAFLGRSSGREPTWPDGIVGSISHCDGLCAAAVAPASTVRFLGIDAEPNIPLKDKLLERISSAPERVAIAEAEGSGFTGKTLFSAKESIFKALYPEVQAYFGFEEVEITPFPGTGIFEAILSPMLRDCVALETIQGRYLSTAEHTMTAVQLSR